MGVRFPDWDWIGTNSFLPILPPSKVPFPPILPGRCLPNCRDDLCGRGRHGRRRGQCALLTGIVYFSFFPFAFTSAGACHSRISSPLSHFEFSLAHFKSLKIECASVVRLTRPSPTPIFRPMAVWPRTRCSTNSRPTCSGGCWSVRRWVRSPAGARH